METAECPLSAISVKKGEGGSSRRRRDLRASLKPEASGMTMNWPFGGGMNPDRSPRWRYGRTQCDVLRHGRRPFEAGNRELCSCHCPHSYYGHWKVLGRKKGSQQCCPNGLMSMWAPIVVKDPI
ncbi:hypothetical protein PIB30_027524 [Stylosanthes scabra]|uniref:Uncharacterized protein n=1 Tax=Stylosanthes scabra TaxID=79078 RepID=A0ABU6SC72_9FABA|nr:hypothetical protein [Stylosanthes scabra]